MAKVEIQVRHCFCCGLSLGSLFVAIYTLLIFLILFGIALYTYEYQNDFEKAYENCSLEVNSTDGYYQQFLGFIILDSSTYNCSLGLYTNELKFEKTARETALFINIAIYFVVVCSSLLLILGLLIYNHYCLIPWILIMIIEVIRGFISTILIFCLSHGILARIATGIFLLGVQFFHVSLIIIIIAKFQRIYNRKKGIILDAKKPHSFEAYNSKNYPPNYVHSPTQAYYHRPPIAAYNSMYSDYSPSQKDLSHYHPSQQHGYYDREYLPAVTRY